MRSFNYKGGGVFIWFLQRITGFILLALLLAHIWVIHYSIFGHELSFSLIAKRVATPLWKTIDSLFLVCAVFHGLNGAWMIASDYLQKDWLKVGVFSLLIMLGTVLIILGILTIIPFQG